MTEISDSRHVVSLLTDYVLELLPGDESDQVTAHLSRCQECQRAMAAERQVGLAVKTTLRAASSVDQARLRRSMPLPPVTVNPVQALLTWSPGLAAIGILLLIIGSTLVFYLNQRPAGWSSTPPAAYSTAVMMTNTPTMTATSEITPTAGKDKIFSWPEIHGEPEDLEQESRQEPVFVPIPAAPLLQWKDT